MKAIAAREGHPYVSGNTLEDLMRKGGREARQEKISPNLLTQAEAYLLARKILNLYKEGDMSITLNNLDSHQRGYFEPKQILRVDLSAYDIKEIPITRTQQIYMGDINGVPCWSFAIEANIEDHIEHLIATSGKSAKRISDQSADDTVKQDYSHPVFEQNILTDQLFCDSGEAVDYLCDDDGNISDMRFVIMAD